jgi:hypothetical protein
MAGTSGGFLQAASAQLQQQLKRAVASSSSATEYDRQTVLAFLTRGRNKEGYVPKSGEITGILKEIKADFDKALADVEATEADAVQLHEELIAAKTKQVQTLSNSIEKKMSRIGDLEVEIVQLKNDLTASEAALIEDQKLAAALAQGCDTKKDEWAVRQKSRAEELVAIHETIKILNDDDALDLFKKTLSLLQMDTNDVAQLQRRAKQGLLKAQKRISSFATGRASGVNDERLDFLALALSGKKADFSKIHKMIDDMVKLLAQEQFDDDHKKEYCEKQIDQIEDKGKELKKKVEDLGAEIENSEELISTYTADIKTLEQGIAALDKSVMEATETRKAENEEFKELMTTNTAAKQLIEYAKNRLNKFYSPSLYKAPPAPAPAPAFIEIARHQQQQKKNAISQAPETWNDAYATKSEGNKGVISMLDLLIRDLTKEMTVAETDEKNSQEDYEKLMQDAAGKRAADLKVVQAKQMAKAEAEEAKSVATQSSGEESKTLMATQQYEMQLHQECDWLQQNHEIRKQARASEVDSLKQAKAILAGSDFSLIQRPRL